MIPGYPVISLTTTYTHKGSLRNLLGHNPDPQLVTSLSSELQVTQTPPTFLFSTDQDTAVPPENSVLFYLALRKNKAPAELPKRSQDCAHFGERALKAAQTLRKEDSWTGGLAESATGTGGKGAALFALANFSYECAKHGATLLSAV